MVSVYNWYTFDTMATNEEECRGLPEYVGGRLAKSETGGRTHRRSFSTPSPLLAPVGAASTLSEKVYRALKRDIIHGVYQPGESLNEKDLAARYRGSRTPVREAAVRLANETPLPLVHTP